MWVGDTGHREAVGRGGRGQRQSLTSLSLSLPLSAVLPGLAVLVSGIRKISSRALLLRPGPTGPRPTFSAES